MNNSAPLDLTRPLTLAAVVSVARGFQPVAELAEAEDRIAASAAWVAGTMREQGERPIAYYGINTGFGDNAGKTVLRSIEDAERLSRNLLLSHCVGVGEPFAEEIVRAALLIRAASLAKGYSGVRRVVINTLVQMLNQRVHPVVPAQGSLGASGDLAPLAHLVIPMSEPLPGDPQVPGATGFCDYDGLRMTGADAMAAAGIARVRLGPKEGVALINGTSITAAAAALATFDARGLYDALLVGTALSVEAMCGFRDAFLPHINNLRSPEQSAAAARIDALTAGSTLVRGGPTIDLGPEEGPPQDPYCLRCAPVVMGAALQTLDHVERVVTGEINAVTDNPLVFGDELPRNTKIVSGGNFHGEPLAFVMDFLVIALCEMGNIAERRIFTLTDPKLNRGLPAFLVAEPPEAVGLNSGLMLAQYTAASLVSENKTLAYPASVDSIPSSANREDHVSMSTIAARKALNVLANAQAVCALELLCAAQALDLRLEQRPDTQPGTGTAAALTAIRNLRLANGEPLAVIRRDTVIAAYLAPILAALRTNPAFLRLALL